MWIMTEDYNGLQLSTICRYVKCIFIICIYMYKGEHSLAPHIYDHICTYIQYKFIYIYIEIDPDI